MKEYTVRCYRVLIVGFIVLGTACSSNPSATPTLEAAQLAINEAVRYEAPKYASSELSVAQNKLAQAQAESEKGRSQRATRLAEQAAVDARYAQSRALAQKEQIAAIDTRQTAESLRQLR
jgi:hypothetical protein